MTETFTPSPLFQRVERARRRKPNVRDTHVTLAHGSGGKAMHELIEGVFLEYLGNPILDRLEDHAVLEFSRAGGATDRDAPVRLAYATDSYVVTPIFFPGGDIGRLAVNGTVNDLAVSGARPLYLSAGFILEEGFPLEDLRRVLASMRDAAAEAGVQVVTGDTKVVQRGGADKLFINTSGVGVIESPVRLSASGARVGDKVILSGTLGDHGTTIMIARGELELETEIESDTAPLGSLVRDMLDEASRVASLDAVHCLRDPTRGGVATTLNEIALASEVCIEIREDRIPVREEVRGACEILGLEPLYVANEGKLVAIVSAGVADALVARMRQNAYGRDARVIGEVTAEPRGIVALRTGFGGTRIVDMLVGEQLPRIC
ncbi:MAG: hydrogenase expression/formation protein HypE [Acidobacteria bacterium]|nr:hydrogenase expression/formation protein HypE [Acidobacteriota bacterium]MCA1640840.1 hydrogenase expression/formation protein HypE [Acidobacteriota bacterium]